MSDTEKLTKTYRGNCHCATFIFEIELPLIKSASECRCSICVKKAYLWVITDNRPTIVKGEGTLVSYGFAGKKTLHQVSCSPRPLACYGGGLTRPWPVLPQLWDRCHGYGPERRWHKRKRLWHADSGSVTDCLRFRFGHFRTLISGTWRSERMCPSSCVLSLGDV